MRIFHYVSLAIASYIMATGFESAKALTLNEVEATGTATNNTIVTAEEVPAGSFTTPVPLTVFLLAGFPDGFPTATISGTGGEFGFEDVDFYSFSTEDGDAMFDIDGTGFPSGNSVDTILALFNDTGTLIAFNDDSSFDDGNSGPTASFIGLIYLDAGTYFIAVTRHPNFPIAIFSCISSFSDLFRPDGKTGGWELPDCTLGDSSFALGDLDGGVPYTLHISLENPVLGELPVAIDILPGSDDNSINLGAAGVIPVAILGSADFDAESVLPESVFLANAGVKLAGSSSNHLCHVEDVGGPEGDLDGWLDLVCKVETAEFMIEPGEAIVALTGETEDGTKIRGEDHINIVP